VKSLRYPDGKVKHTYVAKVEYKYKVKLETWHNVAYQICTSNQNLESAVITGDVIFHNPYGFIPGELFGMLPFEVQSHTIVLLQISNFHL
jgi:hypothetical protein